MVLSNRSTYDFNDKSKLSMDITYFTYLSQQAGGLNDAMFNLPSSGENELKITKLYADEKLQKIDDNENLLQ